MISSFFFFFPSAWVLINHRHVPQSFYELCRILFAVIVKYIYELVMKFFFSFSGFPSSIHPYYTDGSGGGASTAERPASALHQVRRRSLPGLRTPLLAVSLFWKLLIFFLQKIEEGVEILLLSLFFFFNTRPDKKQKRRREKMCVKGFNIINLSRLPDGWDRWRQITATNAHTREDEDL